MDSRPSFVVPAAAMHADLLAGRVARDHAREVRQVSRLDPREGLLLSLAASVEAYTVLGAATGEPVLMMGVGAPGLLTGTATVWMLGAEGAEERAVRILRAARWGLKRAFLVTGADCLEQFIPAWYRTGLRFAARMGFSVDSADCRPAGGMLPRRVAIRREDFAEDPAWRRRKEST